MIHRRLLSFCVPLLITLTVLSPTPLRADNESAIRVIRKQCEAIDAGERRYTTKAREVFGRSTEGGEVVGHYLGTKPQKLVVTYYGEGGKAVEEYYLDRGHLIFLLRTNYDYKLPIYMEGRGAGKIVRTTRERFYFQGDRLLRWVGPEGEKRVVTTPEAKAKNREQLQDVKHFLRMLANPPVDR